MKRGSHRSQDSERDKKSQILRTKCPIGHSIGIHAEAVNENQIANDVEDIDHNGQNHRRPGILDANEPTLYHHQAQGRGRGPNTDLEIGTSMNQDFWGGIDKMESNPAQRNLKQDQQQ